MDSALVLGDGGGMFGSLEDWIESKVQVGYFCAIFCLILLMAERGSLKLEREMMVPWGVRNCCWKLTKLSCVRMLPIPVLGMPMPCPPKAAQRIYSAMSALTPAV